MGGRTGRLLIWTIGGTAGDVRPLAALAAGLRRRGRDVFLVTPRDHRDVLESAGLDVTQCWRGVDYPFDPAWVWLRSPRPVLDHDEASRMRELFDRGARNAVEAAAAVLGSGEHFCGVAGPFASVPLLAMAAAARGLPYFLAGPMPYAPSSEYMMGVRRPRGRLWGLDNRLKWAGLLFFGSRRLLRDSRLDSIRAVLRPTRLTARALRRFYTNRMYHLLGVSPTLFPRPRDWTARQFVTGYCYPRGRDDRQPAAELNAFLDAGPAPVYIGFGSYAFFSKRPGRRLLDTMVDVVGKLGKRAVVQPGLAEVDPAEFGDHVFFVGDVPHAWLFPRCAGVVHHGGGGTFHAALKAGRPMVCYPFQTDQFFWAQRAAELGVAPACRATVFEIEPRRLENDLRFIEHPNVKQKAAALAGRMAGDPDGTEVQAEIVSQVLGGNEVSDCPSTSAKPP